MLNATAILEMDHRRNSFKFVEVLQKRSKRRIQPGVAILLAVIILNAGYFAWWYYSHTTNGSSSKGAPGAEIAVTISGTSYHYSQLTEKQQYVYQQLFRACENYEPAEAMPESRLAVLYASCYLYDHRENADFRQLGLGLRALLMSRKAEF